MALVLASPYDTRDYQLKVDTVPSAVIPGKPFTLRLAVIHPGTGQPVTQFEVVHEKRYHLFLVSRDLEIFEHIHPEQLPDGTWSVSAKVPKPGVYLAVSDFLPARGSSQFIARPIITAGYTLDMDPPVRMDPDEDGATKTVDDITAAVSYQPARFWAEVSSDVTFTLKDSATGEPVTDVQPYLGSLGHMFVMSEDTLDYVHAHPALPPDAAADSLRGGQSLTFNVFMPKPGRYKAWTQFRHRDKIYTFPLTFTVLDPSRPETSTTQRAAKRTH
jgi:hypothetical protein